MKKKTLFLFLCGAGSVLYYAHKLFRKKPCAINNYNNIGLKNEGKYNVGNENVGNFNIGSNNLGSQNLGDNNIGEKNLGSFNSGDNNYGFFNIGRNTFGCFNTKKTPIYLFNKRSNLTIDKWLSSEAYEILLDMPDNDSSTLLRQAWFDKLPAKSQNIIKNIDNFNSRIFERITGINVNKTTQENNKNTTLLSSHQEAYEESELDKYLESSDLPFETAVCIEQNKYPEEH